MANSDLFAPPTAEELKSAQSGRIYMPDDLFAPPTKDELTKVAPTSDVTGGKGSLKGQALLDYMKSGQDQSDRGRASLGETVGAAGNVADYAGGLMRTGLANDIGLLTGKPLVNTDDVKNAFLGAAPTSAEYMKRGGVPEGPSVLGVSARDAAGFGADVATDPISYVSPIGEAAEGAGKSLYKSGLKKVDERLAEKGAGPISDLLLQEGKSGTTKQLAQDTKDIGQKALSDRQGLYQKADQLGAKVDMNDALKGADSAIAKMRSDPGLSPLADNLSELVQRYKDAGKVSLSQASEWKTNLYNALPESAFNGPKLKGPAKDLQKVIANDFKNAIVDAGNSAEKGLGDNIGALNEKMQTTIGAQKPLDMQVRRANTTNAITPIDAMLAAGGELHSPAAGIGLLAAKKAADAAKTTYVRTKGGLGLINAGKSGLLDTAARQGLLRKKSGSSSPGLIDQDGLLKVSGEE